MPEKSLENPIAPDTSGNQEGAAEFLAQTHAESLKNNEHRYFKPRPDEKLAQQANEIIGPKDAHDGLPSVDAVQGEGDPDVELLQRKLDEAPNDVERINLLMKELKNGGNPSDVVEAGNRFHQ